MNSNKIIVHFARVKNVLIADIVNMPKVLIGSGKIIGDERYEIASASYAALTCKVLYLTGNLDNNEGYYLSYSYGTEGEAQAALECFSELIKHYNNVKAEVNIRAGVLNWRRAE
nr:MAG TPA: hypothetical protein [Caudoviricetes sp.]